MKTLPADLEALMPEPFGYVPFPGEFYPPDELDAEVKNDWATIALFTADQMREAIRGATERAAKIVESGAPPRKLEGGRIEVGERARNAFAAAIRSGGEAGS